MNPGEGILIFGRPALVAWSCHHPRFLLCPMTHPAYAALRNALIAREVAE